MIPKSLFKISVPAANSLNLARFTPDFMQHIRVLYPLRGLRSKRSWRFSRCVEPLCASNQNEI